MDFYWWRELTPIRTFISVEVVLLIFLPVSEADIEWWSDQLPEIRDNKCASEIKNAKFLSFFDLQIVGSELQ